MTLKNTVTVFDEGISNKLVLEIYENGNVKWDSTLNIDYWPEKFKERYSEVLLITSKSSDKPKKQKLKDFFFARGTAENYRLFQELFRGLEINIGAKERDYIKQTVKMASEYFNEDFREIERELVEVKIA